MSILTAENRIKLIEAMEYLERTWAELMGTEIEGIRFSIHIETDMETVENYFTDFMFNAEDTDKAGLEQQFLCMETSADGEPTLRVPLPGQFGFLFAKGENRLEAKLDATRAAFELARKAKP